MAYAPTPVHVHKPTDAHIRTHTHIHTHTYTHTTRTAQGYTGHSFNDHNHCDLTAMRMSSSHNENEGDLRVIALGNQLGNGIKVASLEEAGPGGRYGHTPCVVGGWVGGCGACVWCVLVYVCTCVYLCVSCCVHDCKCMYVRWHGHAVRLSCSCPSRLNLCAYS